MTTRLIRGPISSSTNKQVKKILPDDNTSVFLAKEYLSMCKAIDIDTSSFKSVSDINYFQDIVKNVTCSSIHDINLGLHDLKIPILAVLINQVHPVDGAWILNLIDPSDHVIGIKGYISSELASLHEGLLNQGTAVLLHNVSIFINKDPFSRYINITSENISSVFD